MWILLLLLVSSIGWAKPTPAQNIVLIIGEKNKIPAHGDLFVGPEKAIQVKDLGSHYLIEAIKPGWTQVRTGDHLYEISVLRQNQIDTFHVLEAATKASLNLHVRIFHGEVRLEGRLTYFGEWQEIYKACMGEDCSYVSAFKVSKDLRPIIQGKFAGLLQSLGYGSFQLRWEPALEILIPKSVKFAHNVARTLEGYGINAIEDAATLDLAPSIRVQIMIMEVKKSESQKYGLEWNTSYQARLMPTVGGADQLMVTANFLETQGIGKVLANPSLLCASGKESEFLAGGEIPIKIINFKMQDVVWKKYGILLRLKPQADFSGRMSLEIETEVSSLDTAHTVDGVPGLFTNRVQTHFDLSEPRTIMLSGLVKSEENHDASGLLGLTSLPILGPLFSSRDFQLDRSELIILVRPELVSAHEEKNL